MRENRPYGSEGGESGSTGLPYPYRTALATCRQTVEDFLGEARNNISACCGCVSPSGLCAKRIHYLGQLS